MNAPSQVPLIQASLVTKTRRSRRQLAPGTLMLMQKAWSIWHSILVLAQGAIKGSKKVPVATTCDAQSAIIISAGNAEDQAKSAKHSSAIEPTDPMRYNRVSRPRLLPLL